MKKSLSANANMITIGMRLYNKGYVSAYGGNISIKTGSKIVITPTGFSLADIEEDDLVVIDLEGNVLFGINPPSSETQLHLEIYKRRPEICGIVHSHPPVVTSFAYVNKEIIPIIPEANAYIKKIPIVPCYPVGSRDLAESTAEHMQHFDVAVLEKHGLVTCGKTLAEAYNLTELVEETAIMNMHVDMLMHK